MVEGKARRKAEWGWCEREGQRDSLSQLIPQWELRACPLSLPDESFLNFSKCKRRAVSAKLTPQTFVKKLGYPPIVGARFHFKVSRASSSVCAPNAEENADDAVTFSAPSLPSLAFPGQWEGDGVREGTTTSSLRSGLCAIQHYVIESIWWIYLMC